LAESWVVNNYPNLGKIMENENSPVYVFNTHAEAEDAIQSLVRSGFDVKKLSIIGKGYHSEERAVGFYTTADKIKSWGGAGAFWGGIWGVLLAPAVFFLPGVGLVAMAGPFVATLVGALEGAAVVGGVSALGAALTQIGVKKEQAIKYETALKVDKYILMVHGDPEEISKARLVLGHNKDWQAA
jgi:ABC-type antimicrobial peptide transport system permease subunit